MAPQGAEDSEEEGWHDEAHAEGLTFEPPVPWTPPPSDEELADARAEAIRTVMRESLQTLGADLQEFAQRIRAASELLAQFGKDATPYLKRLQR